MEKESASTLAIPEYLFHYTSVDTLALILKNRTIRFNPLYKMDDPLEQWSRHGVQEGHFVFISSWSDRSSEDINMWKNYCKTGLKSGVRISLRTNPFSWSDNHIDGMRDVTRKIDRLNRNYLYRQHIGDVDRMQPAVCTNIVNQLLQQNPSEREKFKERQKEIRRETVTGYPIDSFFGEKQWDNLLMQVEYTDKQENLFPWMYIKYRDVLANDYSKYGRYKDTSWKWQSEWRYRLHFSMVSKGRKTNKQMILYPVPFDFYDLKISDNTFKDMRIMLSPQISAESRNKVSNLIAEYCPTATLTESLLAEEK